MIKLGPKACRALAKTRSSEYIAKPIILFDKCGLSLGFPSYQLRFQAPIVIFAGCNEVFSLRWLEKTNWIEPPQYIAYDGEIRNEFLWKRPHLKTSNLILRSKIEGATVLAPHEFHKLYEELDHGIFEYILLALQGKAIS